MPPGGDGLYFFYINFFVQDQEAANFVIRKNGSGICRTISDMDQIGVNDNTMASCAAIELVNEGNYSILLILHSMKQFYQQAHVPNLAQILLICYDNNLFKYHVGFHHVIIQFKYNF